MREGSARFAEQRHKRAQEIRGASHELACLACHSSWTLLAMLLPRTGVRLKAVYHATARGSFRVAERRTVSYSSKVTGYANIPELDVHVYSHASLQLCLLSLLQKMRRRRSPSLPRRLPSLPSAVSSARYSALWVSAAMYSSRSGYKPYTYLPGSLTD